MKKYLIVFLLIAMPVFAGEWAVAPKWLVVADPLTENIELQKIEFIYGNPYQAKIYYEVWNQEKTRSLGAYSVTVFNRTDDPETDVELCTAEGVPFSCCTGMGTGDCNESNTDFTELMSGIGGTLNTRAQEKVWSDVQNRYETQVKE
jgi:hypothetical protein